MLKTSIKPFRQPQKCCLKYEMKTQTQNVPLLTSTQVYYFILFIYASKFMSLQIKKPLSAQAVGTDMYKNGGVSQIKPATKQPE